MILRTFRDLRENIVQQIGLNDEIYNYKDYGTLKAIRICRRIYNIHLE